MKKAHICKLEDLLKALLKNGLKIFPRKCQLFKTELQYMGNVIFIRDRKTCVRPLRSRVDAILKLKPPTTSKGCRSFAGMVNFLTMFCPELQKLLTPIYDLTRKGRHFIWGEEHQEAFEEIKRRLIKALVLHMPHREGRFHLYSDTSKFAAGSALLLCKAVHHYVNLFALVFFICKLSRGFALYFFICTEFTQPCSFLGFPGLRKLRLNERN